MRIYIHTDLEGISGIDSLEMIEPGHPRRREANENLMADAQRRGRGRLRRRRDSRDRARQPRRRRQFHPGTPRPPGGERPEGKQEVVGQDGHLVRGHFFHRRARDGRDAERVPGPHAVVGELVQLLAQRAADGRTGAVGDRGGELRNPDADGQRRRGGVRRGAAVLLAGRDGRGQARGRAEPRGAVPLEEARARIREAARRAISLVGKAAR